MNERKDETESDRVVNKSGLPGEVKVVSSSFNKVD
jgi:hypothetical protein